ncbi:MAG: L-ribulose-5-phosphate 4-epimerase [Ruminiclostridium sp.]|nr:L-ribulose-5-phosphate 4-epimerase [Ruminiclostridium sp.]
MLEELRKKVYEANMMLQKYGLVKLTWGNVSGIDREQMLVVIKPSGVAYEELTPEKMVVVNMRGEVVEGELNPSTDTPTHIALYQAFDDINGVTHTHSKFATVWAQAGLDIPAYGTTHADYFYGDIPCTLPMADEQINGEYEKQTGFHIADTFAQRRIKASDIPACLVASHGPFTWGSSPAKSVENAVVLEEVAEMAIYNMRFEFGLTHIQQTLLDKHYLRKHGAGAYYGQGERPVTEITANDPDAVIEDEAVTVKPSLKTVELINMYEMEDAVKPEPEPQRPFFNRIPGTESTPPPVQPMSMPSTPPRPVPPVAPVQQSAPVRPVPPTPPVPPAPPAPPVQPAPQPAQKPSDSAPTEPSAPKGPMNFTF